MCIRDSNAEYMGRSSIVSTKTEQINNMNREKQTLLNELTALEGDKTSTKAACLQYIPKDIKLSWRLDVDIKRSPKKLILIFSLNKPIIIKAAILTSEKFVGGDTIFVHPDDTSDKLTAFIPAIKGSEKKKKKKKKTSRLTPASQKHFEVADVHPLKNKRDGRPQKKKRNHNTKTTKYQRSTAITQVQYTYNTN
eukprot:TRINITY_DN31465_c0_g1_i1.p1 TRINITY_DN31465_c0_g1~~TRINITY_DN31465_c0_g1_i1.p1  ORF type:complete len:194 (-),score=33.35 TRINITY_DN31465_c0_g1_i1:31-612(-)